MRVTQLDIARQLGVSKMTVSLAMRNHPRISTAMRQKVQEEARKLNYRIDPLFSHMGSMRWRRQRRGFRGILALITFETIPNPKGTSNNELFHHAQIAAERLGYEIQWFPLIETKLTQTQLLGRQLYHRGIEGVLINRIDSQLFMETFPWDRFAAVECNYGYFESPCHQVRLDRYDEVIMAWRKAVETGHRRIGLVLMEEHKATDLNLRVGAMEYCQRQLFPHLPSLPLTWCPNTHSWEDGVKKMRTTMRQLRPDALIIFNRYVIRLCQAAGLAIPERLSLINLMVMGTPIGETGLREDMQPLASVAVPLLDSLLRTGQIGRPDNRQIITLAKRWVDGQTLLRRNEKLLSKVTKV